MASIYARGGKLWCRLKGVKLPGKWDRVPTPFRIGDEAKARRYAIAAQKRIDEQLAAGGAAKRPITVASWAREWIPDRRALDLDWKNDESRLRHHVLPVIGQLPLVEVRTIDIVNLFRRIRTVPRSGRDQPASQRLVYNIYSVVAAMFRDAQLADRIERSPCVLGKRQLGPLSDKNPEWRASAVFTRDEAETLISDPRIPQSGSSVGADLR